MTTRALAVACLAARGFDWDDPVLVRAMTGVLSNTPEEGGSAGGDSAGGDGASGGGVASRAISSAQGYPY